MMTPQPRPLTSDLLDGIRDCFESAGAITTIRLHGDCHHGNILWTDQGPHFVDLDDCRNGPAVQDLWMLLHGDRAVVQVSGVDRRGRREGAVIEVLERANERVVGRLFIVRRFRVVRRIGSSGSVGRRGCGLGGVFRRFGGDQRC